ncbi:MAG: sigma-70 family RNA polymerase sigma factor [bacterium]
MDEDIALLNLFKNGSMESFEQIVTKYKNKVFKIIYSIVRDANEADDVAQEVFFKVYRSAASFKGRCSFYTWLYRISVNESLLRLRSKKKSVISLDSTSSQDKISDIKEHLSSSDESPEAVLIREELRESIYRVLNTIPDKYRTVVILRNMNDLSYKEISETMNISVNKVKTWLFRARKMLTSKLEPLYQLHKGQVISHEV